MNEPALTQSISKNAGKRFHTPSAEITNYEGPHGSNTGVLKRHGTLHALAYGIKHVTPCATNSVILIESNTVNEPALTQSISKVCRKRCHTPSAQITILEGPHGSNTGVLKRHGTLHALAYGIKHVTPCATNSVILIESNTVNEPALTQSISKVCRKRCHTPSAQITILEGPHGSNTGVLKRHGTLHALAYGIKHVTPCATNSVILIESNPANLKILQGAIRPR